MRSLALNKWALVWSFQGQTSKFQPISPHQWPSYKFSKLPEWGQWPQMTRKYKLHYSEVQRNVLGLPYGINANFCEDK